MDFCELSPYEFVFSPESQDQVRTLLFSRCLDFFSRFIKIISDDSFQFDVIREILLRENYL